jgi:prepilin-type N-terminal cleavage/methylation domain-containing protein
VKTTRRGFTLIELLVVIAIIVVLIALLGVTPRFGQNRTLSGGATSEATVRAHITPRAPLFSVANYSSFPPCLGPSRKPAKTPGF